MALRGTLVTSIPPKMTRFRNGIDVGADYQRECVESWRAAGFDVISVNPGHELESVRKLNLPVDCHATSYEGLPFVFDLLKAVRNSGSDVFGIVNADCEMISHPNLLDRLAVLTENRLLFGERLDVDADTGRPFPAACGGYDIFLFGRSLFDRLGDLDRACPFRIGDPWWDYWFPILALAHGQQVHRLATPIIKHMDHAVRWSYDDWLKKREVFKKEVTALASYHPVLNNAISHDTTKISLLFWDLLWNSHVCPCLQLGGTKDTHLEAFLCDIRDQATHDLHHGIQPKKTLQHRSMQESAEQLAVSGNPLFYWLPKNKKDGWAGMINRLRQKNRARIRRKRLAKLSDRDAAAN